MSPEPLAVIARTPGRRPRRWSVAVLELETSPAWAISSPVGERTTVELEVRGRVYARTWALTRRGAARKADRLVARARADRARDARWRAAFAPRVLP